MKLRHQRHPRRAQRILDIAVLRLQPGDAVVVRTDVDARHMSAELAANITRSFHGALQHRARVLVLPKGWRLGVARSDAVMPSSTDQKETP